MGIKTERQRQTQREGTKIKDVLRREGQWSRTVPERKQHHIGGGDQA